MKAYMSGDRSTREMRLPLDASWFPDGHVGGMYDRARVAEAEARAILADAEAGDGTHHPAIYFNTNTLTHGTMLSWGQASLAEALAAFIES